MKNIYITKSQPFKLFGEIVKLYAFILWTVISETLKDQPMLLLKSVLLHYSV